MYKSIFSQLSIRFFLTLISISLIAFTTLSILVVEEPKRQFSEKLLRYMVSEIGIPPAPEKLKKISKDLGVSLVVAAGDKLYWASQNNLPKPKDLERLTTPETTYEFLYSHGDQVVLLRYDNYTYYISGFLKDLSTKAKITLFIAFLSVLLVMYLNYRHMVWLFYPVKKLKADAIKISNGDIDHRIKAVRNDELGELSQSVNAMAEKLRANIDSKQELLLAISHELRTPLARAKIHLELMNENPIDKQYRIKLDNNLNEINTLIEALLQSEGLSDSSNSLALEQINMSLLVQQLASEYDTERINLELPNNHCKIQADALRIKLLFSNIINNALQYSDGLVTVKLKCDVSQITCSICDQGNGIAEDEIPKLTEAFYRPDKSRQRKTGSHGLGLYLCQKIVEAHKGKLLIKSKIGKGSCVIVTLPLGTSKPDLLS